MGDPGFPGWFVALFVIAILAGIGTTVYRVSLARKVARDAGLDEDTAAATTLFTQNGLDATYLAASLRGNATQQIPAASADHRSNEERLRELQRLKDQGLVTSEEYDARRKAIIDSV